MPDFPLARFQRAGTAPSTITALQAAWLLLSDPVQRAEREYIASLSDQEVLAISAFPVSGGATPVAQQPSGQLIEIGGNVAATGSSVQGATASALLVTDASSKLASGPQTTAPFQILSVDGNGAFAWRSDLHVGIDHVDMHGNSYVFGDSPLGLWVGNWTDVAASTLGARSRRNIAYSGARACWSDVNNGIHGGWSWVLQNILVPGMPTVNLPRGYPYPPIAKLVMSEDSLNDLAELGHLNPTPYLHAHRTIMAARSLAAIYLASGADSAFGTGADAATAYTNTGGGGAGGWAVVAGGGTSPTQATHDTHANAGTGYRATSTATDKLTYTVASDAPTGRVHDICIPVAQADDITLTVTVAGTSYGTVRLQGSTICDPDSSASAILNGYTMRLGSNGPTDPTAGAHAIAAGDVIVLTLTTRTAGSFKVSHCGMEADPLDGPLFVPLTANRMPAAVGYTLWNTGNGFAHGPNAGTDPMNDAAVLSWISSQQTMDAAEFSNRVIPVNADTILAQNTLYWGDGGLHTNTNPHPNHTGQNALGKGTFRAVLTSSLVTDRIRTAARIISRHFFLRVGSESVSEAAFANSWKNANFAGLFETDPLAFSVDLNGRVTLRGVLDASSATAVGITTLPSDVLPPGVQIIYIPARISINGTLSAGFVTVQASTGVVGLDTPASGVVGVASTTIAFEGSWWVEK